MTEKETYEQWRKRMIANYDRLYRQFIVKYFGIPKK